MEVAMLPAVHWSLLAFVCTVLVRLSIAQSGSELAAQDQSPYILFGSSSVGKFVLNGSDVTDPNGEKVITSCGSTVKVVNYYYRMDKLFWVAGTTVFMSNLSVITNRACSAQTIIADENRRPVALAVDWVHDKLFWILEDDHIFDVEQIVEYDLITMDEARVVTNLSVTTVQWLAVYPFPDNGSSVLMWIEQVNRSRGYDIIFISSDTETKERLTVSQLTNCRLLSQYLNVPGSALYLLARCAYNTILYSFDLALRHLRPICYLRTTLGIAVFRDVLYTYSPLQLYSSRLEGAGPDHDLYLREIGHQRNSGDRYRHIAVVDQSLQPEVNEIPLWQPFVSSSVSITVMTSTAHVSLQLSTPVASLSMYTASTETLSSRLLSRTTVLITSSVEYTPTQYTSTKATATPYITPTPPFSSVHNSILSFKSVSPSPSAYSSVLSSSSALSLSVYSSVLSLSSVSSFSEHSSVVSSSSVPVSSSLRVYTSVVSSSSIPAPSSPVSRTATLPQSLPQSTEVPMTSTMSASILFSSATSSPIYASPLPSISGTPPLSLPQPQISTTSPPSLRRGITTSSSSTLQTSVSPSVINITKEPESEDILVIVVPAAAAAGVLVLIMMGAVMLCIICCCCRRISCGKEKKKKPPKFYLYYSEPVARHQLE